MNTYFLIISNNNWWNEDKHGFGQLFNNLKGYSPAKRPNNVKHSSPTHLRPAPYLTSVPQHLRHTKIEPFTCTWLGIGDLQGDSLGICRDWLVTHGCKNCYFRVVTILTEKKQKVLTHRMAHWNQEIWWKVVTCLWNSTFSKPSPRSSSCERWDRHLMVFAAGKPAAVRRFARCQTSGDPPAPRARPGWNWEPYWPN